jgi:hypothetical protein
VENCSTTCRKWRRSSEWWLKQTGVIQNRTTVRWVGVGRFFACRVDHRPGTRERTLLSVYLEHVVVQFGRDEYTSTTVLPY